MFLCVLQCDVSMCVVVWGLLCGGYGVSVCVVSWEACGMCGVVCVLVYIYCMVCTLQHVCDVMLELWGVHCGVV